MASSRWTALYYPYGDFRDPQFALRAALYYDEVYFLQPGFFEPPRPVAESLGADYWPHLPNDLAQLRRAGVLRTVDPQVLGISQHLMLSVAVTDEENRAILVANIRADVANEELRRLGAKHGKVAWAFPNAQFLGLGATGLLFEAAAEAGSDLGVEYAGRGYRYLPRRYQDVVKLLGPEAVEERLAWRREEAIVVPYHLGEALMINVALLAATRLAAVPLTDATIHEEFLHRKLTGPAGSEAAPRSAGANLAADGRAHGAVQRALEVYLPDAQRLTGDRVLDVRRRCRDELGRFRAEMARLASVLEMSPWESDLASEVQDLVRREVEPPLREVGARLRDLEGRSAAERSEAGNSAPLTLTGSLYPGLPIDAALAAAAGPSAVADLHQYWQAKGWSKSNGLSYLLSPTTPASPAGPSSRSSAT